MQFDFPALFSSARTRFVVYNFLYYNKWYQFSPCIYLLGHNKCVSIYIYIYIQYKNLLRAHNKIATRQQISASYWFGKKTSTKYMHLSPLPPTPNPWRVEVLIHEDMLIFGRVQSGLHVNVQHRLRLNKLNISWYIIDTT